MDCLTFVSQIFASAAWPLTVLAVALLLRTPLSNLLPELRKVKWKGLEAEFGKELQHARELLDQTSAAQSQGQNPPPNNAELVNNLAGVPPRHIVLESWREIEIAATNIARRKFGSSDKQSPAAAAKRLLDAGLIDNSEFQVFEILRSLRNKAVHERHFELSKDEALEYAITARWLANALESIERAEVPRI